MGVAEKDLGTSKNLLERQVKVADGK